MDDSELTLPVDGHVAMMTIDRLSRHNAMTGDDPAARGSHRRSGVDSGTPVRRPAPSLVAVDLPGSGSAGQAISQRLCTVFTIDAQGQIIEYLDYG